MITEFIRSLFWISVTGGVFILAAILVRAGVKQRLPKHFLVLLWAAVLLHFVFMQGAPSPTSIYNYVHFSGPAALAPASGSDAGIPPPARESGAPPLETAESAYAASGRGPDTASILFALWLAGVVAILAVFAVTHFLTTRRFSDAFLLKNNPVVDAWRSRRAPAPKVYVSDRTATPLAIGFLRRRIVLPAGLDLSNTSLVESVLEHEYAHCRHFHNLLKALVFLAVALHWFNPLVWVYWLLFNHDIELACDERVIQAIGRERRAEYAHSLVTVAEKAAIPFPLISAFSVRSLEERIVDIMGYKRATTLLVVAEFALAAALFSIFGTAPASLGLAADPPPVSARAGERPAVGGVYAVDANPTDVVLGLTDGGMVIKQTLLEKNGKEHMESVVLSGEDEHTVLLNTEDRVIVGYERRPKSGQLADAPDFGMENARREALARYPRARVRGCELKRGHSGGYVYEVDMEMDGKNRIVEIEAEPYSSGRRHGRGMKHSRGH